MAIYIITDSGNAVTNMANAQARLNTMVPGDIIKLTKNVNFDGTLTLPTKVSGTTEILITTTGTLPATGTRIGPADSGELPKLRVIVNNESAIKTCDPSAGVANNYRLLGLELIDNAFGGSTLCNLGSAATSLANKQDTAVKVPGYITVEQCYIHGQSTTVGTKRGIGLQGHHLTIKENYICNVFKVGQDSQAIGGWNGLGDFTITNNYLEAAGENVLMGGSDPIIPNLVPAVMSFSRNEVVKLPSWRTDGVGRQVKNLFEIKNFDTAHIFGNRFFYNWTAAQPGYPILFTPVNQDGTNNNTIIKDINFEFNEIAFAPGGVNITSHDAASTLHISRRTQNIRVANNLFHDISTAWGSSLRLIQSTNGSSVNVFEGTDAIVVDHNTFLGDTTMNSFLYFGTKIGTAFALNPNFVYKNNLTRKLAFGAKGDSTGEGTATLTAYAPSSTFTNNAIANATSSNYPAGNFAPSEVFFQSQFVDYTLGNYRIKTASTYHNAGTDGLDLGADIDGIAAAYAGTSTVPPNITSATAVHITSLPYNVAQNVYDGGTNITYDVWYKYTTTVDDHFLSILIYGDLGGAYQPTTQVYASDGTTLLFENASHKERQIQIQVTPATLYYIKVVTNTTPVTPALATISIVSFVASTVPSGSILVPHATRSTYPAVIVSSVTDYTVLKLLSPFPGGEGGDILELDGRFLVEDADNNNLKLYDSGFNLLATVAFDSNNGFIRSCQPLNKFYIAKSDNGSGAAIIQVVNSDGTLGTTYTFPTDQLVAIAPNTDGTAIYNTGQNIVNGRSIVQKYNTSTFAQTTFVANLSNYEVADLLVLNDGTLVVLYGRSGGAQDTIIKTFNSAGTLLHSRTIAETSIFGERRLAYAINNPNSFWVWTHLLAGSKFRNVLASDLTDVSFVLDLDFIAEEGVGPRTATPPARFGVSTSCPFIVLRTGITPPPVETATLTIFKITVPSPDLTTTSFSFTATVPLTPPSFSLLDGGTQLYEDLDPGTYGISETVPAGWTVAYSVSNGNPPDAIVLAAGDDVTVTVTNTYQGSGPGPVFPGNPNSGLYRIQKDKRDDTLWESYSPKRVKLTRIP